MKSKRKIAVATLALLPGFGVYLLAQTAGQPAPATGSLQSSSPQTPQRPPSEPPPSDARAKITVNSNLVILPVTVKDRSGKLDTEPSTAPPGGAIANAPSINGHSAIGDSPNITSATMNIRGQSTKALDDAVFGAAQLLRDRSRNRRKLILLISDGANGGKKSNKMTYDSVVKTLLHDTIEVYSVAVASAFLERKLSRLGDYSHHSGGGGFFLS